MGMSTDALLWYGYCWDDEVDLMPEDKDGDRRDWGEVYLERMGLNHDGDSPDERYLKRSAALEAAGVLIDSHCSSEYPIPLVAIASTKVRAWRGHPKSITSLEVRPEWEGMLAEFCRVMGITPPEGQKPQWWLASDMG